MPAPPTSHPSRPSGVVQGDVEAVEDVAGQRGAHQQTGLELEDGGVEVGAHRPHPVLVEGGHQGGRPFRVGGLQADDEAPLAHPGEEPAVPLLQLAQAGGEQVDEGGDVGDGGLAGGDLDHLGGDDAAQFGGVEGGQVGEAVLVEPLARALIHDHCGHRVVAARQGLAGDDHVGLGAVADAAPHLAAAHHAGLHLVGDVQGAVAVRQGGDAGQVVVVRHRETGGGGHALDEHRSGVLAAQHLLELVEIVVVDLGELIGARRHGEEGRHARVPGLGGDAGGAVEGPVDRDDPTPPGGMSGELHRRVDGLAATIVEGHIFHVVR
jgi:hypothetical protein